MKKRTAQPRHLRQITSYQDGAKKAAHSGSQIKLVTVRDGMIGFDTEMLIVGVSYILDADGQRTEIKVGPPDGYKTKAEKKQATQGWADVQK